MLYNANKTKKIAYAALLTAISIILTRVFGTTIPIGSALALRLSFGEIPIILSGLLLGPVFGGATGLMADVIGYVINPMGGAYFPGFTVTAILTGLIPGLFAVLRQRKEWTWSSLLGVIGLTNIIAGVLLNTYWLSIYFGSPFMAFLPPRLITRLVLIPVYVVIINVLTKMIYRIVPKYSKQNKAAL
ncbi:MAG TPA: folate family ECF transporter S component [Clostridiales bacterium]|nr:folate family ECF transporter S component [Clostridiales bacterium]